MPAKKKTNYISYEIEKLEKYIAQLEKYLDDNPIDDAIDRVEVYESTRGNPIIKVVATKEDQVKTFVSTLKDMPKLLEDLNRLRMAVSGKEETKELRGGQEIPGFMADSDDEDEDIVEIKDNKLLPQSNNEAFEQPNFDNDDEDFDEEE